MTTQANETVTAEQLHDAAFLALEASYKEPENEQLKSAAKEAQEKAKLAYKTEFESLKKQIPEKPVVPEKYDLRLPEKSKLDAKHLEGIAAFAKERGLSQEHAAALVERENKVREEIENSFHEAQVNELKVLPEKWAEAAKADKEIGGDKFNENVEMSKRVIEKFGNDAFKEALNNTGLGNHPELIRVFSKIAKAFGEDKLVVASSQQKSEIKPLADRLYGGTNS